MPPHDITEERRKGPRVHLQRYGFKYSQYERPNLEWLCGWRADGRGCAIGPDGRGQCRAGSECIPLRKGDRWHCTRAPHRGSNCLEGPLPDGRCAHPIPKCEPRRSHKAKRRLVERWVVTFTAGMLLLLLFAGAKHEIISPGEVAFQHSPVLAQGGCDACHGVSSAVPAAWLRAALRPAPGTEESRRCLNCHRVGEEAFAAHGLAPEAVSAITERLQAAAHGDREPLLARVGALTFGLPGNGDGHLACALCHREHRGQNGALTVLPDAACQTCHRHKFAAFTRGHPEFTAYPYSRRTRIQFDHVSHRGKHHPEENSPFLCTDCHGTDRAGYQMLTAGFEKACARCHAAEIRGEGRAGQTGVPFLALPGIDRLSLQEQGRDIGEWPEYAEEEPIPFLRLLLADTAGSRMVWELLSEIDLLDLDGASEEALEAVVELVWKVKGLLYALQVEGQSALQLRLEQVLGRPLEAPEFTALSGLVAPEIIAAANRAWLPALGDEWAAYQAATAASRSEAPPTAALVEQEGEAVLEEDPGGNEEPPPDQRVRAGGWYRDDLSYALFYRPGGHADPFIRSWLELTSQLRTPDEGAQMLLDSLSDPKAPGLCMKCHSIDQIGGELVINWFSRQPVPHQHPFTIFNHSAHFSLLDEKGCETCHQLNKANKFAVAFEDNRDPRQYVSNFAPIPKAACADCHRKGAAGESCRLCHRYHIGTFLSSVLPTHSPRP